MPVVNDIKEKTKNQEVIFMPLDLASLQSVRNFARSFIANEQRLDILINNAGLIGSNEVKLSEDGIESTIAVNHLGPFLLTNLLLDVMKQSGPGGRIVNVASLLYNFANPAAFQDFDALKVDGIADNPESPNADHLDDGVYCRLLKHLPESIQARFLSAFKKPKMLRYNNSKLANLLFTVELAKRLSGTGITAYSLHPGVITTEIGKERGPTGKEPETSLYKQIMDLFNPSGYFRKTLEGGAQTTICCAVDEKLANESGGYYSDCEAMNVKRPEFHDPVLTAKFWKWSEQMTRGES